MDKCPYCSAETRPGDNFCLNCGNRLLPPTPSAQQAESVIGDATLPAPDDWVMPNQEMRTGADEAANWPGGNMGAATIANTSFEPPSFRSDFSGMQPQGMVATAQSAPQTKIEHPAHLILYADNGEVLQDYVLEKYETTIGRAPNSDILLSKDKLTSRRHATILYENGNYLLHDEHSANGTFVNGQQLEDAPQVLHHNDHVGIGEHELIFQAFQPQALNVDIESMPTITVTAAEGDISYRPEADEFAAAETKKEASIEGMNGDSSMPVQAMEDAPVAPANPPMMPPPVPETPPAALEEHLPAPAQAQSVFTSSSIGSSKDTGTGITFQRLTSLPEPPLPDVAPLVAALATLDGQVSSLQNQLNTTQEAMRNHEAEIVEISNTLRTGVRRVSERMDVTIAEVARSREQLAWAELQQLMEDVMNNPRDIEYVTKLARKARELNKVFQMHQNVLNTLAECTSLLRGMIGEDKERA